MRGEYIFKQFKNLIIQRNVNAFGSVVVTGNSAAASVGNITYLAVTSFGTAAATFMGQNYGAKRYDRIKQLPKVCFFWASIFMVAIGGLSFIFARPLLSFYIKDSAQAMEIGAFKLRISLLGYAGASVHAVFSGMMRGAGKSVITMFADMATICVFRITWINVMLRFIYKPVIIFVSFPVSYYLSVIVVYILFRITMKRLYRLEEFKKKQKPVTAD